MEGLVHVHWELQFKAVKLEGPVPTTAGARSTHKRELVHPTSTAMELRRQRLLLRYN